MSDIKELVADYVLAVVQSYHDFNLPPEDAHVALYTALDDQQAKIAKLEAQLAAIKDQKPVWYVVESANDDDDMLFRDPEVAAIYARGLSAETDCTPTVTPLYTLPK